MTDPLEGVTDAHLQAVLDALRDSNEPAFVRRMPTTFHSVIAHARQIAANEKLAAELDELRAKYEPEPVDPVLLAARELVAARSLNSSSYVEAILQGLDDDEPSIKNAMIALRRGMEMQPAPFTREEAERIADKIAKDALRIYMMPKIGLETATNVALFALTTPPAELRAMLGDG